MQHPKLNGSVDEAIWSHRQLPRHWKIISTLAHKYVTVHSVDL